MQAISGERKKGRGVRLKNKTSRNMCKTAQKEVIEAPMDLVLKSEKSYCPEKRTR